MHKTVYADNNATTCVAPEVLEVMLPFLKEDYFNPSSMYDQARPAADAIKAAKASVARHLGGVEPSEVLFTSCATESNNAAIFGTLKALARSQPHRRHVITTSVEHPAVLELAKDLERDGYDVTYLSVDRNGQLDMTEFIRAIRPETALISIMHANNESGVIFPIAELARIAKETDPAIVFHTDATQSMGKLTIDLVGDLQHIDLLSFSGHKLHAPKGVGVLFQRRGTPCRPFMLGGHQESGRRAGTENVAFIVGLARAVELAAEDHDEVATRIEAMRDRLEKELAEKIPAIEINGKDAPRMPNTSNLACHYIEGEGMLFELSGQGICASSGSACTSGSLEPSHVLLAMKVPFTAVHGSIRFSFSRYTTDEEVDHIISVFPTIVANLRKLSPYWDNATNAPHPDAAERINATPKPV
jgi:cysteine desulfurase